VQGLEMVSEGETGRGKHYPRRAVNALEVAEVSEGFS
jgi:hypothetical protein